MLRKVCGGSNLSTFLALWGIYIKKCISPVRIRLRVKKPRNTSTKFRKTSESKKAEKSLEISAFLVFSCLHLNQTRIMAGVAGFGPTNAGVKVPCLTAWLHPNNFIIIASFPTVCQVFCAKKLRKCSRICFQAGKAGRKHPGGGCKKASFGPPGPCGSLSVAKSKRTLDTIPEIHYTIGKEIGGRRVTRCRRKSKKTRQTSL